jgi:hypothetical protein
VWRRSLESWRLLIEDVLKESVGFMRSARESGSVSTAALQVQFHSAEIQMSSCNPQVNAIWKAGGKKSRGHEARGEEQKKNLRVWLSSLNSHDPQFESCTCVGQDESEFEKSNTF